ncbi:MAG: SDR family oxidoreductase [Brevirhabdus sp.]
MPNIIVTGASSGIGLATACKFMEEGWQVGLLARRRDALEEVARGRSNAYVLAADVTDPAAVDAAFDRFVTATGRLDALFNNAGLFTPAATIDEIAVDDWLNAVNINLTGMFLCARAAFARMRAQDPKGGRIVNNGSISADSPREGSVCYTTTKHGVTGLTKTLSLDGRPFDIACGQIDIGNARTPLLQDIVNRAVAEGQVPPPTMDVAHVADAVFNMVNLPLEANVQFMTLMATKMPFIGRG